jgi:ankyrin repeat protein
MLLGSNASVNCKDYQGKSALDIATSPVIKQLLESKNRKSSSSRISNNTKSNDTVVQQQGQQQPDSSSNTLGDNTEVVTAVRRGDYVYFLDYVKVTDNDLTIRCANGNTLLHEAALHLPPGAIDILIYHGLQVDDVNHAGETALMLACEGSE